MFGLCYDIALYIVLLFWVPTLSTSYLTYVFASLFGVTYAVRKNTQYRKLNFIRMIFFLRKFNQIEFANWFLNRSIIDIQREIENESLMEHTTEAWSICGSCLPRKMSRNDMQISMKCNEQEEEHNSHF